MEREDGGGFAVLRKCEGFGLFVAVGGNIACLDERRRWVLSARLERSTETSQRGLRGSAERGS